MRGPVRLGNAERRPIAFIPKPKRPILHRPRKPRRIRRGSSNLGKPREVYMPLTQATELRPICEMCAAGWATHRNRAVFHNVITGRDICARCAVSYVLDSKSKALYITRGLV